MHSQYSRERIIPWFRTGVWGKRGTGNRPNTVVISPLSSSTAFFPVFFFFFFFRFFLLHEARISMLEESSARDDAIYSPWKMRAH